MAIEIIDGVGSENHVTSDQVGLSQAGTIGTGAIILPVGQQLGYEIVSNNQVNIKDGVYVIQGKRGWIRSGTVEQCTIQTGNNGQYRNDLICIKYTKNAQSKVEEFSIAVVKGTPGASGADPTYTTGDINDGALESYAPIYRVRLNGINIIGVDLMASKVSSLLETAGKIGNLNDLATSAKTSLVAAANELQAAITALNGNLYSVEQKTGDILSVTTEIRNRWYFASTENGNYNFPDGVSWGFIKYVNFGGIILCILLSGENHAISINTYNNNSWGRWIQS